MKYIIFSLIFNKLLLYLLNENKLIYLIIMGTLSNWLCNKNCTTTIINYINNGIIKKLMKKKIYLHKT